MFTLDKELDAWELRTVMLGVYGADETLREKVRLRVLVRPFIVFGNYVRRGDAEQVEQLTAKIKQI